MHILKGQAKALKKESKKECLLQEKVKLFIVLVS